MFLDQRTISNLNLRLFFNSSSPLGKGQLLPDLIKLEMSYPKIPDPNNLTKSLISRGMSSKSNNNNFIENQENEIPKIPSKKYKVIDLGENNMKLPSDYSTDDPDEFKLIQVINENTEENYKLAVENKNKDFEIKTYKKKDEERNVYILKSFCTIFYPIEEIKHLLIDVELMDQWEKTYTKHISVEKFPKDENTGMTREITYLYLALPLFITDRDFVDEVKTWYNYNGDPNLFLKVTKASQHEKYPPNPKQKPVRGEEVMGGFYVEKIGERETKMIFINHVDLKMTKGADFVNSAMPDSPKNFVSSIVKYLKK